MKKPKNYGHCLQSPSHVQDAEIIQPMYGKFKQEEATNPQHNSSDAQNVAIHSENTAKHCAFTNRILEVALNLRKRGYSYSYLTILTIMVRH